MCVIAADKPDQNLSQYFSVCNDFIHSARLKQGNVLIHCLAGMSRSVTVAVAYIMCVTPLSWKEALKVVRAGRSIANPNLGFQNQLQEFETSKLIEERRRLKERFPSLALESTDKEQCYLALDYYEELLESKGVCEGHCKFGKDCPTGICRTDSRGGIRPSRKPSLSSKKQYNTSLSTSPSTSSQLSVRSVGTPGGGAQSCPTSPRCSKALSQRQGSAGATRNPENPRAAGEYAAEIDLGEISELRRSSSIVSTFRPRSSPAGLYSYTGSAPPSIHGSRVDLSVSGGTGSAIYLGSTSGSGGASGSGATTGGAISASSSPGPARQLSMRSTPKSTPRSTPESSPKASPKKSASTRSLATGQAANTGSPKKSITGSGGRTATVTPATTTPPTSTSSCPKRDDKPSKPTSKTTVPSNATNASTTTTTITASAGRDSVACKATPARTPSIVIDITTTTATITTGTTSGKDPAAYGRSAEKRDATSKDTHTKGAGGKGSNTTSTSASSKTMVASNNANNRVVK
uniref:Dual specificity protein phosphatase 22 n=1 Tax=Anopheles culicifacies TaxID=139723 RepID=A0A182MH32_9DIPT